MINMVKRVKSNESTSKVEDNISNEQLMKKLRYVQEQILENKEKLNNIEDVVRPEGGFQPKKDGLQIFREKEDGSKGFTEVGRDIFKELRKQGHLTRHDLEDILIDHDMSRTKPTYLNYLQKIAAELSSYFDESSEDVSVEFKQGTQGGRNGGTPSRVIINQ